MKKKHKRRKLPLVERNQTGCKASRQTFFATRTTRFAKSFGNSRCGWSVEVASVGFTAWLYGFLER